MLVTLDCSDLSQTSRNALFMSNRETFRDDPLLTELFKKLQNELKNHEGLIALDQKRYQEKIANATTDDEGVNALEELLSSDPALANMFGSMVQGKVAARMIEAAMAGLKVQGKAPKFEGTEFPSFFRRADGSTDVKFELPQNDQTRVSFLTDVKNNYFTRAKNKGKCEFSGSIEPTFSLVNGRLTFTYQADRLLKKEVGTAFDTTVVISDAGHGPWKLAIKVEIGPPRDKRENESPESNPKADSAPSRPDIIEVKRGPDAPPIVVDRPPGGDRLQLQVNVESRLLVEAKLMRAPTEAPAVEFVFKYGLALIAMGLIDAAKKTEQWNTNESECREEISKSAAAVGRVIVPLCLTLPKKLPKAA
jgi:hypothetical protein